MNQGCECYPLFKRTWSYSTFIEELFGKDNFCWTALSLNPSSQKSESDQIICVKSICDTKMTTFCHNHNSIKTQLKSWVWHENDFRPPTTTTTNSMSLISQLFLRFLGSTTTITTTTTTTKTKAKFHLILTWFWPNFNGKFLGSTITTITTTTTKNKQKKH